MNEEEYREQIADAQDSYEGQQEYQEELADSIGAGYPQQKEQLGLYQMFWKILGLKDSTKVAFADKKEVGPFLMPVRGSQHMAHLSKVFHHPKLAGYFTREAEIVLASTMGREGNFPELFVSQKKYTTRSRKSSGLTKEKWSLFGKKKSEEPQQ